MANKRQGQTERASQWWKHLRPFCKRVFWKRQRRADDRMAEQQFREASFWDNRPEPEQPETD